MEQTRSYPNTVVWIIYLAQSNWW